MLVLRISRRSLSLAPRNAWFWRKSIYKASASSSGQAVALQRLETLNTDLMSAEATKLKRWIDGLLNIPFGKVQRPVVSIGEGQEAVRQ